MLSEPNDTQRTLKILAKHTDQDQKQKSAEQMDRNTDKASPIRPLTVYTKRNEPVSKLRIAFVIEWHGDKHLWLRILWYYTYCLPLNKFGGQSLTTAYLKTGSSVFILEQPGNNHLPLSISWQDTLCLSLNNLETIAYHCVSRDTIHCDIGTITYHCVSRDRIHCVYPRTTWGQSFTTAYLATWYIVFILEEHGDNLLPLRISWEDTLCLSLNYLETITYHCVSRDRTHCVIIEQLGTIT